MTTATAIDLKQYDIVLAIDKSGSMSNKDTPGNRTRWDSAKEAAGALARKAAEFDDDGITVVPFASSWKIYDNVTPDKVDQVFTENNPMGGTNTSGMLEALFNAYFERKAAGNAKPVIIQVITDGAPDDKAAVSRVITEAANKLDDNNELGVQFLQYGQDSGAAEFLRHLDDDLQTQGAKFDIVDAKTAEQAENIPLAELLVMALTD